MSSMLRLLAASISMMSIARPSAMLVHMPHSPQGSPLPLVWQLMAFARMRAVLVLPVPRGPVNR